MVRGLSAAVLAFAPVCDSRVVEHVGLLQSKNGQPRKTAGDAGVDKQSTDHLQHVHEHLNALEIRLEQGPVVEQNEIDSLKDVVTLLKEEFGGELARQHSEDVSEYAENLRKHNACQTTKDDKIQNLVGPKAAIVTTTRNTHRNCRFAEDALDTYVQQAKTVADTWTNLANYKASHDLSANSNLCLQSAGSHDTFHTLVTAYDATSNSGSCEADQSTFESAFCDHFEEKAEVCFEMDSCVAMVDLQGLQTKNQDRIKHRKAMDLTLAKLDCRLNHVITVYEEQLKQGGEYVANVADTCDTVTGDASQFDMVMEVPNLATCSGDADINDPVQPSKEDAAVCTQWKNQEYINPSEGQLPGQSWACKHSCIAPQRPASGAGATGPAAVTGSFIMCGGEKRKLVAANYITDLRGLDSNGWTMVANYQDDDCQDDIPNNLQTIADGFQNANAAYIGNAKLQEFGAASSVRMCIGSSRYTLNAERNFCYDFVPADMQGDLTPPSYGNLFKNAAWGCKNEVTDPMGQLAMFLAGGCKKDSSPGPGGVTKIVQAGCSENEPWTDKNGCVNGKSLLTEHAGPAWHFWGNGVSFEPRSQWPAGWNMDNSNYEFRELSYLPKFKNFKGHELAQDQVQGTAIIDTLQIFIKK